MDYNERVECMDIEGENTDGEEETNLREGEGKKRMFGKRNITIKMPTNREEDYEDKTMGKISR